MDFAAVKKGLEDGGITLVDVRGKDELEKHGKIPGSRNLPVPELEEALKLSDSDFSAKYNFPKPDPSARVVTHCMKGARAAKAAEALKAAGFKNAVAYPGSFLDWQEKGGKVDKV